MIDRDESITQTFEMIRALQTPEAFSHPVSTFQLHETHISWVLLTGNYAYKFKKPVNLGFVDFTSLDRRRFYCEEELRLNRRLAPDLYLDVQAVTGSKDSPRIGDAGDPIEYCVHMRQFDQRDLLDQLAESGRLREEHIDSLVQEISAFHECIPTAPWSTSFGDPATVADAISATFISLATLPDVASAELLRKLRQWCDAELARTWDVLAVRKRAGLVRECHGDMHLGNMVLLGDRVTVFDGIEFSAELRWIDIMSELAFCQMDLEHRRHSDFGWRLLNGCLERSGDYAGLAVLPLYFVYRALVRAKVAFLRMTQSSEGSDCRRTSKAEIDAYLGLAFKATCPMSRFLAITHGVSGSGKSHGAREVAQSIGAIRVRSDVERKRLASRKPLATQVLTGNSELYSDLMTDQTYSELAKLSLTVLNSGFATIVDATFLSRAQRIRFRNLAMELGVPFMILDFPEEIDLCRRRIRNRQAHSQDPSDATEEVLEHQLQSQEPLHDDEKAFVVRFENLETAIQSMVTRLNTWNSNQGK